MLFSEKTRSEMAGLLNVSQGSLSEWANYKKQVPWDKLALAKSLSGRSWDWMLGADIEEQPDQAESQNAHPEKATPIEKLPPGNAIRRKGDQDAAHKILYLTAVGDAAALEVGASHRGGFDDEGLFWENEIQVPESTHLIRIRGDSMSPVILHGQFVMVGDQYRPEIGDVPGHRDIVVASVTVQNNDIGGMDSEWEGVHCKRIQDAGDFWLFTSINPSGETFTVAKDNCRLWRVIGVYFAGKGTPPEGD